jgi:hypothetical protein
MNRRSFFARTLGAIATAVVAPHLLRPAPTTLGLERLTFNGIPITFSRHCSRNAVYYVNPQALCWHRVSGDWMADEA